MLGPLLAILSALGSSAKAILVKLAYRESEVDAVTLLALRMLFSMPAFFFVAWWSSRERDPLTRRDWAQLAGVGLVGFYLASFLDFWGLTYISVGLERLILFTYPAMVVVLAGWWLRKPVGTREISALLVSFAGIGLAFWGDVQPAENPAMVWAGGLAVLGAALSYALYMVGVGQSVGRLGSFRLTGLAITISTFFVLGHFAVTHPVSALRQPTSVYWLAAAMALFSTVLPIFLNTEAIRLIGAARVSIIGFLGPILTILLGYWFLSESITGVQLAGTALVMAGVALASRGKS